jgi:uncharacterized membrane protein
LVGLVEVFLEKVTSLIESGASFELFPGIKALAMNVHPMLVHFPIAFLSAFFVLELLGIILCRPGLRQAASWMIYLGALGAAAAVAAGLVAAGHVPHGQEVHEVMEWHQRLMLMVFGLSAALAVWRALGGFLLSPMALGLHLLTATVMMTLLVLGTDLGGLMVYQHGVGVRNLQEMEDTHRHAHSATADSSHLHKSAQTDRQ